MRIHAQTGYNETCAYINQWQDYFASVTYYYYPENSAPEHRPPLRTGQSEDPKGPEIPKQDNETNLHQPVKPRNKTQPYGPPPISPTAAALIPVAFIGPVFILAGILYLMR